ncbi:hypothetical protein [Halobacillus sp. A5]|uniref:hypothetical protein n=1 Tax=Halobacillus sp. A5 TaxID=2880263 RepID=UPI0020A6CA31|nr:hypothetical protein [Halobacillus sp. A5]MCP3026606.1 hypothetical protein [Halobacillus sp. A5]
MPKPPMNDTITLLVPTVDDEGQTIKDKHGRPITERKSTDARVQYTAKVTRNNEATANDSFLVIDLPPETEIEDDYTIEWTNRFGKVIKGPVEGIEEVLNYGGTIVYFRKVYMNKTPAQN